MPATISSIMYILCIMYVHQATPLANMFIVTRRDTSDHHSQILFVSYFLTNPMKTSCATQTSGEIKQISDLPSG